VTKDNTGDNEDILLPCGLIANSFFNDTFKLKYPNSSYVPWKKNGIALSADLSHKFSNPRVNATGVRIINNFKDEDFVVWMRVSGLPTFKKLYRIINDVDLPKGNYSVVIENLYPEQGAAKYFVISTCSWMGGQNYYLGGAYLIVGFICLIMALVFLLKHLISPRKLGDESYLKWNR